MQARICTPVLIIGLGNNDPAYTKTYHNVGFLMIDYLATIPQLNIALGKNEGYMNEAGADIKKLVRSKNIQPEQLLIVHDDSDIALGSYKLSFDRGAAGHKGVASTMTALGSTAFWRLRIGIRPPEFHGEKAEVFVLKKILKKNLALLQETVARAAAALHLKPTD